MSDLDNIRHSLAHLLAAAALKKYPQTKLAIGPTIENGFYYDFKFPKPITADDLKDFEKTMRELVKQKLSFAGRKVTPTEAKKIFKNEPFKLDLIKEFVKEKKTLTVYKTGEIFLDLCRGGHVKNTSEINPDAFKLTHLAGAYWRGSEKNPMLTRIYGVAFAAKKELDKYLTMIEEAQKRDHKVLGPQLELFMTHETAPGMPYWLPKGMIIMNELIDFWRKEHGERGYQEISSPLVNKKELWQTSGHWEHYKDDMFIADMGKNEVYGVKPMNCPNAMIVFGSKSRSYKELPLRLSDTDILHRYERSGTLNGLFRVRSFRQDDSHNFVTESQIEKECADILDIADRFYGIFNLKYTLRLSTKPKKFMGDVKTWNKAETSLKKVLDRKVGKNKYIILEGEGAFYGPKIDILMKDSLGREWQMGTIQLDFQQPRRFNLAYTDKDGKKKTPVVIHRVIYGSLDRFIGVLIEHFAGAFPVWLSPIQVKIIPVGKAHRPYAEKILKLFKENNIRPEISPEHETVGKNIRQGEIEKIPYLLVVGDKEMKNNTVNVRERHSNETKEMKIEKFLEAVLEKIKERK